MTRLLATVLPEVSGRPSKAGIVDDDHRLSAVSLAGADIAADSASAAFEQGRDEGLAQGRAEVRTAVEAAKRAWDEDCKQREQESQRIAELVATRTEAAIPEFLAEVSNRIAELLSHLVREEISRDAIAAVVRNLEDKIRCGEIGHIRVSGDQPLVAQLRRLQEARDDWNMFEFSEEACEGAELRIDLDLELLETRIQPWLAQVDEICRTK